MASIKKINKASLKEAKDIILNDGVVGIPTETVYGLGASAFSSKGVKAIYEAKGRPSDNPLICHVHNNYDLNELVYIEQDYVNKLIKTFMPGPLTLVFKSKGRVCSEAVCGGKTLAIRMPSHKGCQKFLKFVGVPIVAPSANISKHTSPVTATQVKDDLEGKISLILDGGKSKGGIESTVLDVTGKTPRILRPGLITQEMIGKVVGECEIAEHKQSDEVKSPGVKYSHYMPKCQTALFEMDDIDMAIALYDGKEEQGQKPYIMCDNNVAKIVGNRRVLNLGKTGEQIASNLYDKLLEGEKKADIIIAVSFGREDGVYFGIMNRLNKSCAKA